MTPAASLRWQSIVFSNAVILPVLGVPGEGSGQRSSDPETWMTRVERTFEVPGSEDGGVGGFARLRIGGGGANVVVLTADPGQSRTDWKVLVWSLDGRLQLETGSDDAPSGLRMPTALRAGATGFQLNHGDPSVTYAYAGGQVMETTYHPAGLERFTPMEGGGLLGFARIPGWFDGGGQTPVERAVLHATRVGDKWKTDTIATLDIRHQGWYVQLPLQPGRRPGELAVTSVAQPFADHDLALIDAVAGSLIAVRRNSAPGVAEVTEILANGDTVWHRHLVLEAIPVLPEQGEQAIKDQVGAAQRYWENGNVLMDEIRSVFEEAIHIPSHLPSVSGLVAASSEDIWLKTPRRENGHDVWYAIARGDHDSEPRRVLMPVTFRVQDAHGDRIWGFSRASAESPRRIVELRLVPPPR